MGKEKSSQDGLRRCSSIRSSVSHRLVRRQRGLHQRPVDDMDCGVPADGQVGSAVPADALGYRAALR